MNTIVLFLNSAWSLWLPEDTPRQLVAACRALALATAFLWSMTAPDIWIMWAPRAGTAVISVAAFMCWLAAILWHRLGDLGRHRDDEDWRNVTRALADAVRRLPEDQRRDLLVRSAR